MIPKLIQIPPTIFLKTIIDCKWRNQGSQGSFRPHTGWGLHRFVWKLQQEELKGRRIDDTTVNPTLFSHRTKPLIKKIPPLFCVSVGSRIWDVYPGSATLLIVLMVEILKIQFLSIWVAASTFLLLYHFLNFVFSSYQFFTPSLPQWRRSGSGQIRIITRSESACPGSVSIQNQWKCG